MIPAQEALKILYEGNHRFVSGVSNSNVLTNKARRHELVAVQKPFAIILGCSDSRVPAEIVFDKTSNKSAGTFAGILKMRKM